MSALTSSTTLLEVRNVAKEFPSPAGSLRVLRGVSFALDRGRTLAITGPSGSGKTTLLNIIASLDEPTSGDVVVDGQQVPRSDAGALQAYRSRQVGLVFQEHRLFPQLTAGENVLVPTLAKGCRGNQAKAPELLKSVGMSHRAESFAWQLSGGERQRIAIARAMVNGAPLLLCDEPTGNLDRENATAVADLLLNLARDRQIGVVIVTHNLDLAARCDAQLNLRDGAIT